MITHNSTFENFDKTLRIDANERQCGDCTYCCDGWLTCNIFGYAVYPGSPCKFVKTGKGCTAYDFRPEDPCKTFKCYYKQNSQVPDKFKPSLIGNVLIARTIDGIPYLDIVEGSSSLSLEILDWALSHFREGKIDSLRYFYKGVQNWVTRDPEFEKAMQAQRKKYIQIKEV